MGQGQTEILDKSLKGEQMDKYVYTFGNCKAEGKSDMKNLLGGKGANLAEMCNIGIPVPAGFTITTMMCEIYYKNNKNYPPELLEQTKTAMANIEQIMDAKFGDADNPLLVSVRSGARVSMPGMMDTVLNLGLNDTTVKGLIKQSNNERFGWDSYRRFVQMYGDVVLNMKPQSKEEEDPFEVIIHTKKKQKGVKLDTDLTAQDLKELVSEFKAMIKERIGKEFPEDPWEQLWEAISAVFGSWNNERAIKYRAMNKIPSEWGTAVNVQSMVYGNMGDDCATGVAFTRDPSTGEKKFYGEYLINAQGEDVVAGIRTPQPINATTRTSEEQKTLEEVMPEAYKSLEATYLKLEEHYKDMQDIEFTIQRGKLWMLQTRTGKRTAEAAIRIAVEMVKEGMIDKNTALLRVEPSQLDQLLHPTFDPKADKNIIGKGLPASPGAATGKVVFHADEAEELAAKGEEVILVRIETSPEDIGGMDAAKGILTARGGMTSHAAVVARGMGKCCVAGCSAAIIDYTKRELEISGKIVKEREYISLNGSTGEIMLGQVPTIEPTFSGNFATILSWADEVRKLKIRTNADTPDDSNTARNFGAEGIGLCRTEHMFFEEDRIKTVREMILAENKEDREKALSKLLPIQKKDFYEIFKVMQGLPVTIRLLDPPLHEFLPQEETNQAEMAKEMGISVEKVKAKVNSLHEFNPMLGHRGCRLGMTYPEISVMQTRAIIEAACELTREGLTVIPEIMVPLVGTVGEFQQQKTIIENIAKTVIKEQGIELEYMIGTMIEIPRAALIADKIAEYAQFFSFGTNDLTQMTFGYSRDDAGSFLPGYVENKILKNDPFQVLDQEGVGQLVQLGVERGRSTNRDLKIGICGEHGGEPGSIEFCYRIGLNYVSCSPYRVPIARLAAAQAVLKQSNN